MHGSTQIGIGPTTTTGSSPVAFVATADGVVVDWFRQSERALGVRVCGTAGSVDATQHLAAASGPTVFVIDHELADGTGIDLVQRLRRSGVATPVLIMSSRPVPGLNEVARRAGASGTVVRADDADDLAWSIAAVARGRSVWDERNVELAVATPRELEVLSMIADGQLTCHIAAKLFVSSETVKSHVQSLLLKFGAHTRAEAVAIAVRAGLI